MNELHTLYHISLKNDMCSFVYKDIDGEYKTGSRAKFTEEIEGDKLIFLTKYSAEAYIKRNLNIQEYEASQFWGNDDLYKNAIRDTAVSLVDGHCDI